MIYCPLCDSPSLEDKIGKLTCEECKSSFLHSINMMTGERSLKEIKWLNLSVKMRSNHRGDKKFRTEVSNSPLADIITEGGANLKPSELRCSFCQEKVDRIIALRGKGAPKMSVELEITSLDPAVVEKKIRFNSPTLISCPNCCLIPYQGKPVKYKPFVEV